MSSNSRRTTRYKRFCRTFAGRGALALLIGVGLGGCAEDLIPPAVPTGIKDSALITKLHLERDRVIRAPRDAQAWGSLGMTFQSGEWPEQAAQCYGRAHSLTPTEPKWPHLLALTTLSSDPDLAERLIRTAVKTGSGRGAEASRSRLVTLLMERGRIREAEHELKVWLGLTPDHPAAHLELARIRLGENRAQEALQLLAPCLTNRFTASSGWLLLAQAHTRLGDVNAGKEAAAQARSAQKFDWPDPYMAEVESLKIGPKQLADRANQLLIEKKLTEAEGLINRLTREFPVEAEGWLLLGRYQMLRNQCAEAEATLRAVLAREPQSLNGLMQLSLALICEKKWEEAVVALEAAARIKPDYAPAYSNLAHAWLQSGNSAQARNALIMALRCNPVDQRSMLLLCDLERRAGDSLRAREWLKKARAIEPNDPRIKWLEDRLGSP